MNVRRKDIITADLTGAMGSVQDGIRPCIVISNNRCNKHSPVITVVPLSTKIHKMRLPTHLKIDYKKYNLPEPSFILAEQILSIDKDRIMSKVYKSLNDEDMSRLEDSIRIQVGLA